MMVNVGYAAHSKWFLLAAGPDVVVVRHIDIKDQFLLLCLEGGSFYSPVVPGLWVNWNSCKCTQSFIVLEEIASWKENSQLMINIISLGPVLSWYLTGENKQQQTTLLTAAYLKDPC